MSRPVASFTRIVVGLDQARRSGWGIARELDHQVVASGVAKNHAERVAVIRRALELAARRDAWGRHMPHPRDVFVFFEKHDDIPLERHTPHDRRHMQRLGAREPGARIDRNAATIHGIGKAYGRWEAVLDECEIPQANRGEIPPDVWRKRVHGTVSGDVKRAAREWAARAAGRRIDDDDEAEGYCMTAFAVRDGLAKLDADKRMASAVAKGKREAAKQGSLGFGGE